MFTMKQVLKGESNCCFLLLFLLRNLVRKSENWE